MQKIGRMQQFLLHLTKLMESFFISFVSDFPCLEMTKMTEDEVVFGEMGKAYLSKTLLV